MSLSCSVFWLQEFFEALKQAMDVMQVELSGSLKGGRALNDVSGLNTTTIL